MKLTELGVKASITTVNPIFVGEPVPSGITSSEGEEYFAWKLSKPVLVGCSTDPNIDRFEADELYVRQSLLESEEWVKDGDGVTIPGYKVDFSKGQAIPVFQATTIKAWARGNRTVKNTAKTMSLNEQIRARIANKAGDQNGPKKDKKAGK